MDGEELEKRKQKTAEIYRQAGADLVINSIRDLPEAIDEINHRLMSREEA